MNGKYYECIMAAECKEKNCPHNWLHYYGEECGNSFCEATNQDIGCIPIEEAIITIPPEKGYCAGD